jgi:hypothetical protein
MLPASAGLGRLWVVAGILLLSTSVCKASTCLCHCGAYDYYTDGDCSNCESNCFAFCPSVLTGTECNNTCFPQDARVQLNNGTYKTMEQLEIGDVVQVGAEEYSEVYMFSHRDASAVATFVTLTTAASTLVVTGDHYVYANGHLTAAQYVQVGDELEDQDGRRLTVTSTGRQQARGLYNPHTLKGDIVVKGIKISTYTQAIAPGLAHAMLWPVIMLYKAGVDVVGNLFDQRSILGTALFSGGLAEY